ncbi:HlyD family secretion protein [Paucibacter oligotrophus]|uniref:HlyD family secretion protein n=1 Tax=Roseateles oligotrophus TaxID=1769250 RepID=A0A840LAV6_9BURK|nr:efflux RND transporter periplasmic adaptor subunit [Roseateles oligotrophus]MBB4843935.1 HlyD family secretion protein [Roseateles oligotrophus]
MDIQRALTPLQRLRRQGSRLGLAALLLGLLAGLLALRLQARPSELTVSRQGVLLAAVEQGPLQLDVRAAGLLLPSQQRWIAAQSEGRVERVEVQAGTAVRKGQVLLQLSNPQLQQALQEIHGQWVQARAEMSATQLSLESQALNQRAATQRAEFALRSAELQWEADQELLKDGMVSKLAFERSRFALEQARQTLQLELEQLSRQRAAMQAQLEAKRAALSRWQQSQQRAQDLLDALSVRAPDEGVVQELNLQPGQSVAAGANLAKLARAGALYAQLQVQEAQARDIALGQAARLDLRSGGSDGQLSGRVSRVAAKVSNGVVLVDVEPSGALPRGARPDLGVDGVITLSRLDNTLQLQRPVFSQALSSGSVFRLGADGVLERVPVQFGPASVGRIALLSGLRLGDQVVVSDTSAWREAQRVRLR